MRNITLLFFTSIIFSVVTGQDKAHNLVLSVSPLGTQEIGFRYKNEKENEYMKIQYSSYMAVKLAYETQKKGKGTLVELSYAESELQSLDKDILSKHEPNLSYDEKITSYSFHLYGIVTINKQKRFQIPLYFGAGGHYIDGGPVNAIFGMVSGKARLKFYLTNKIGLFGGYSYDIGLTYKNFNGGTGTTQKLERFIDNRLQHIDSGITFSL